MRIIIASCILLCLRCQTLPHAIIHGNFDAFANGNVFLVDVFSRDTLATAVIRDHDFTLRPGAEVLKDGVTPAMLLCLRDDHQASTSAPVAVERTSISVEIHSKTNPTYSGTPTQKEFSRFVADMQSLIAQLMDRSTHSVNDTLQNAIGAKVDSFYLRNRSGNLKSFASLIVSDQVQRGFIDPADLVQINALCRTGTALDSNDARICSAINAYYDHWEGIPVRTFDGVLSDGGAFSLNDVVGTKPVILDFWASWCGPCVRDMPALRAIYNGGKAEIIGISIDDSETDWKRTLQKLNLPWRNLRDNTRQIRKLYNVSLVPAKFVVNTDGMIIARNPEDLRSVLDTLRR